MIENDNNLTELAKKNFSEHSHVVKESKTCLVLEDSDFFYKIKPKSVSQKSAFEEIVTQAFVQVYQDLGLDWELYTIEDELGNFLVERRQKLEVFKEGDCSFDELISKSSDVKRLVENKLEFPRLMAQLRLAGKFEHIQKLTLIREAEDDFSDFALFGDNVILLGNSNYFIAPIDARGVWDSNCNAFALRVSLSYGDFFFTDAAIFEPKTRAAVQLYEVTPKWWMYTPECGDIVESRKLVAADLSQMLADNLKVVSTKKKQSLKINKNFPPMQEVCDKLLLKQGNNG